MPIYEYECEDCSTRLELRQSFKDIPEGSCPKCKGKMSRLFSSISIIFKGPGFYVTDNRKKDTAPEEVNKT